MQPIEFDVTGVLDKFNKLSSSMPFLISKASNEVAFKRGRKALSNELNATLDVKAKAMGKVNAIKVIKSDKNNLSNTLFFHLGSQGKTNTLNQMMELQQKGGTEDAKTGKLAIPHRGNMSKYAGLPRSKPLTRRSPLGINKIMDKAQNKGRVKGHRVFIKPNGVYLDIGKEAKLLYSFVDKANHNKKLLKFQKAVEIVYNKNFERFFEREYLKALKG